MLIPLQFTLHEEDADELERLQIVVFNRLLVGV